MESNSNNEEKSNEILLIIESKIKEGNEDIEDFSKKLIKLILSKFKYEEIENLMKAKLSNKKIYFIRHAEAEHNVLEAKYRDIRKSDVYDSKLTKYGKEQTMETLNKMKKKNIKFDSVFISPLTRTIQTFNLIKEYFDNKKTKFYITDFVKELVSYCNKNKGVKLSELRKFLKENNLNIDSSFMTKEYWWFNHDINIENEYEGKLFPLRLQIFVLWLIFRKENNILIISHSHVHSIIQGKGIYNADFKELDKSYLFNFCVELFNS